MAGALSDVSASSPASVSAASPSTSSPSAPPRLSGVQSRRVIFIDLGRALAVTFMLYGHTVSALLATRYQVGPWFEAWQFQRGLTSSLFLLLGGFAFSVATSRHWTSHVRWSPSIIRRVRRFGLFILLGYALHFPVARLAQLPDVSEERWRSFLAVDVLQLIGSALVMLQLLVLVARSRERFTALSFSLAALVLLATPYIWTAEWVRALPVAVAAYLTPDAGSLFPLFPWVAFVFMGAGFGQLYARWGAANLTAYSVRALIVPGGLMLASAAVLRLWLPALFGTGPGSLMPAELLLRGGTSLVLLAAIAHLTRSITRLPHVFGAMAQESLLIYFVHLCIVYGSVWNRGLAHYHGAALPPAQTALWVGVVLVSMAGLALYWNWWKHARPRVARAASYAAGAFLVYRLL